MNKLKAFGKSSKTWFKPKDVKHKLTVKTYIPVNLNNRNAILLKNDKEQNICELLKIDPLNEYKVKIYLIE